MKHCVNTYMERMRIYLIYGAEISLTTFQKYDIIDTKYFVVWKEKDLPKGRKEM